MAEVTLLGEDAADAIHARLVHYSVGIVKRGPQGSEILGSGVLAKIGDRCGILTCGHVAELYDKQPNIGIVRYVPGISQRRFARLDKAFTIILDGEGGWTPEGFDLAFTFLPPDVASSIEAQSVFLNLDNNRARVEKNTPPNGLTVDVILGLIAELSGEIYEDGAEMVSPMRALLHSGKIIAQEKGLLRFQPVGPWKEELPKSFGGTSGAGLWRAIFDEDGDRLTLREVFLCGVAAQEIRDTKEIICQGWDRIDQALMPKVREHIR